MRKCKIFGWKMWKNQANKDDDRDEVEAEKEGADEDEDLKFDSDNVKLEDNEEYFKVYDAVDDESRYTRRELDELHLEG